MLHVERIVLRCGNCETRHVVNRRDIEVEVNVTDQAGRIKLDCRGCGKTVATNPRPVGVMIGRRHT